MKTSLEIVDEVASIVHQRMAGQQAGHGVDHVRRVHRNACEIQAASGGDRFVVELAAWLHDVGDAKFHDGVERSGEFSEEILCQLGVEPAIVQHVVHIVDNLSFRKRDSAEPLSLEGQIVQDADRLDAIGAIGIVRTIEFGAAFGQPFHLSGADPTDPNSPKTGMRHFYDKLFRLKGLLNTDAAKQIAEQREQFMHSFVDQFRRESEG
ncbi:HD domain-containing protein [Rhodopirellula halodulae]|uniref:HD domain-containing protein n=1 Tax=Rhodopirellula halodulae TaxID=2894198 RepID=UPI001E510EF0|nr:HD domain-containing protein [Rhodopirellula sp. JC737]MCC9656173.1 HD domain-containing protein [Rhodopirellula sp. JC737]